MSIATNVENETIFVMFGYYMAPEYWPNPPKSLADHVPLLVYGFHPVGFRFPTPLNLVKKKFNLQNKFVVIKL